MTHMTTPLSSWVHLPVRKGPLLLWQVVPQLQKQPLRRLCCCAQRLLCFTSLIGNPPQGTLAHWGAVGWPSKDSPAAVNGTREDAWGRFRWCRQEGEMQYAKGWRGGGTHLSIRPSIHALRYGFINFFSFFQQAFEGSKPGAGVTNTGHSRVLLSHGQE